MKRTVLFGALLSGALLSAGPAMGAGTFYKWVDDNGVTHYTEAPPADEQRAERVRTWNSASSDQEQAVQRLQQRREKAAAKREEAAKPAPADKEKSDEDKGDLAKRCEQHEENLKVLREQPMVRKQDPATGEQVAIDAEERQRLIQQTEEALKLCP